MIWLSVGNAGTDGSAELLAVQRERVEAFLSDPEASLLILDLSMQERPSGGQRSEQSSGYIGSVGPG